MPRTYAADLMDEPGFAGRAGSAVARMVPTRRSDVFMLLIAVAASATVLVNALALQGGRHVLPGGLPSLLGGEADVPLPVPAPPEARQAAPVPTPPPAPQQAASPQSPAAKPVQPKPAAPPAKPATPPKPPAAVKPTAAKPADMKPTALAPPAAVVPVSAPAPSGIGALTGEITGSVRPPAEVMSPRVLAVQKALANLGYGPLRVDGRGGAATREAIERFERDRRLPISGEVSDRLVRELNSVSGTSIE